MVKKWYAISGSWRTTDEKMEADVRSIVSEILRKGNGIVTGGALGVDYIATQVVLEEEKEASGLKVYLPIRLDRFCDHYHKRADEGVITQEQADMITSQLKEVKRKVPGAIHDRTEFNQADKESYYARNTSIVQACDVLLAFQVDDSEGVQDAIDKARSRGKKVVVRRYRL